MASSGRSVLVFILRPGRYSIGLEPVVLYGWCELKTPFAFNVGLGQTETVTAGGVTPTFGVHDIDAAISHLREHEVNVEDWHEIPGMVRLSTFYDPDGTPWMLAQTLDVKAGRA